MATMNQTAQLNALIARAEAFDASFQTTKGDLSESMDTVWMLLAGLLVFFMHAGFSLLEAGCVRFKNSQNILSKNLIVITVGFLAWYFIGWALAYGATEDPNKFAGGAQFVLDTFMDDKTLFRNWFFQGAFCATGATIVSGAMAERTALKGFAIYTLCMTSFIYPIVVYWGWSGSGFLNYTDDDGNGVSAFGPGYLDFAGSGLVHLVGGMGALTGAVVVGPRKGRFDENVDQTEFIGHSVPFCVVGTLSLWFGWYGFNPGSTLSMNDADTGYIAGIVAMNTTLAPCMAGLVVFLLRAHVLSPKKLDVPGFCNGILGGLVAITAGCAFVKAYEACIIGAIGGIVYQATSMLMVKLKVDDVVDAFAVHGACGIWGTIALGFFGNPEEGLGGNGYLYGGNQMGTQVLAIVFICLWVGLLSLLIFYPLKLVNFLRLSDEIQEAGADVMEHTPKKSFMLDEEAGANPAAGDDDPKSPKEGVVSEI